MKRVYRLLSLIFAAVALFSSALGVAAQAGVPSGRVGQIVVPQGPNPVLTKVMLPSRPKVGQVAWIKVVAYNAGSANADNVVITDPIPDNMALLAASTTQGNIQYDNRIVTVYAGTLGVGQMITVTNDVVVTREFADDTPFTNCSGLTFRDGTARLACFPLGPATGPVSIANPPSFLPEAGSDAAWLSPGLLLIGVACLWAARRLHYAAIR